MFAVDFNRILITQRLPTLYNRRGLNSSVEHNNKREDARKCIWLLSPVLDGPTR